jgi:uncharacterized iron-regulated protein
MIAALALFLSVGQGADVDPLLLPIGAKGRVTVQTDQMRNLATRKVATPADVAHAAEGTRYVYLGEEHGNALHHKMQADIIRALAADGRHVVVGMEQFTRPVQPNLAGWTLGWYTEDEFIAKSDWKKQWGMDYSLYKPIFDAAKDLQLPIVALNIPREWVHNVGQKGLTALTDEEKAQLPSEIDVNNKDHRSMFQAMMGGHPMTGMDNMYAAQVLWDVAMSDTAVKYMAEHPSPKEVMVVIAGSGHVMYRQGINWRVKGRTGDGGVTVVMGEDEKAREVSAGVGDFFYLTRLKPSDQNKGTGG